MSNDSGQDQHDHADVIQDLDRAIALLAAVRDSLQSGDDPFARKARAGLRVADLLDPLRELETREQNFWKSRTFTVSRGVP